MKTRNSIWAELILSLLRCFVRICLRLLPLTAERRRWAERTFLEMVAGLCATNGLGPLCAMWGGRDTNASPTLHEDIQYIATKLADHGIGTETGGSHENGNGVMHHGLAGGNGHCNSHHTWYRWYAIRALRTLLGPCPNGVAKVGHNLTLESAHPSPHQNVKVFHTQLWSRKFCFILDCEAGMIVFPGGIGTDDEESEILTILKLLILAPRPVVFFSTAYWGPTLKARTEGFALRGIHNYLEGLYSVTDDKDEAADAIIAFVAEKRQSSGWCQRKPNVLVRLLWKLETWPSEKEELPCH
jgi:hypothetical protein